MPNYNIAPGEYVREWMEADLARRLGTEPEVVTDLLAGRAEVTEDLAERLEDVTGTPARLWLAHERGYRRQA